ncbi:hypothetical protein Poli38472_005901 [Pythium oligandrum]|uniref:Uncharacterized protein n=1 Tax=Pythium oligandrum TaxID=41045 RepID=A0A8K1CT44_PYTOL|nr:hypothetical protein Poli38472_005901 [Pythium oligandrum]|eukprot:TMW68433.1 hypothetical protein Poli38472_005901 [Pythium oligandrum]
MTKSAGMRVPVALLALYFLHSFFQTFPTTAYGKWLFNVIHMAPATTTIYFSASFFPWNLKPLYGLISDNFPIMGYHRKSYIVICEIGAALSLLITGTYISSITGAFVVRILDAIFEAFAQIMLGIFLVDLAAGDSTSQSSAQVQSWANGTKNIASIIALFVGIPLYKNQSISPQAVISWTSVFPILAAVICVVALKEKRKSSFAMEPMGEPKVTESLPSNSRCGVVTAAWTSFKDDATEKFKIMKPVLPTMLFFFLCSALPDDGTVWYQYTYELLQGQEECLQYASLVGMVGRFVSCIMYAKVCSGRNVRHVFVASTVSSVVAGLPRLLLTPPVANLPISVCTFGTIEAFITSFTAEFALLQLLVVATFYCPENREVHGLTYALYLSFMDFGGVVSGMFSSVLVTALGIVPDPVTQVINWDHLWLLVVLSALGQLLVLAFLYVLPEKVDGGVKAAEQEPLLAETRV